jgi:tetratricopeptide (TPR) repeat protein
MEAVVNPKTNAAGRNCRSGGRFRMLENPRISARPNGRWVRVPLGLLVIAGFGFGIGILGGQDSRMTQEELAIQDAIQADDLASAWRLVGTALQRHPHEGGLLNLRGVVHARRNDLGQARADFIEAVRLAPGLTAAWQNLARVCQLEAGQDTSAVSCAIDSWRHVLRVNPKDGEAHASLGLLYEREGKFDDSLSEIEKLSPDEGSNTGNLAIRCADLCGLGRTAEAQATALRLTKCADFSAEDFEGMQNALGEPKAAGIVVILVEALDARQAAPPESLRRLAIAYEQLQRIAEARKTLERVAIADPKNPAHLLELARLAELTKDHEGALGYLAHARDLAPDNAQIHYLFAEVAAEMDLVLEARRSLDRALALDPENPRYNYAMGAVILATRDTGTAVIYFEKFVRAKPENPAGHYALGIAYFTAGEYERAKVQLREVESNPKTAAGAEYFLGRMARLDGDLNDAARRLRQSIELMPSFSEAHTELARVLMLQKKMDEAHAELDRAVRLDPTSFQGNEQLLALYRRTHDPRAEKQAEVLKKLDEERSRRAELMLRSIEVRP